MTDLFDRQLRDAARALPVPGAPRALIDRVIAEREAGERIILPTESAVARRSRFRTIAGLVAVAAVLATIAVLIVPSAASRPTDDVFASDGLLGGNAYAEQTASGPTVPPLSGVNGLELKPRSYTYRVEYVTPAGHVTPDGGGTVNLVPVLHAGIPAWRIDLATEQTFERGQRRATSETVFVSRRDLKPLARAVHTRPYLRYSSLNIAQRFSGDSVLGEMTTDGGVRRPIARRLPAQFGPYLSDAYAPLALVGVPLAVGKTMALSIVGWAVVPMDVFYPVTLRVTGEERIVMASGTYDCWKIDVTAGRHHRVEWVRKADGLGLRSLDTNPGPNGQRRFELLNP
jgi:hypothetical protein